MRPILPAFVVAGCSLIFATFPSQTFASSIWMEVGDAGDLPTTAQTPIGMGALTTITGQLTGVLPNGSADVFEIYITGGGNFSARAFGTTAPLYVDAQLFLFDGEGSGVYANNDVSPPDPFTPGVALLPANDALTPLVPGRYFLAISAPHFAPVSTNGAIFPCVSCIPGLVGGPTGPGGALPITGWSDQSFSEGAYAITLTGVEFPRTNVIPEPTTMLLVGTGFFGLAARRRSK